MDTLEQRTIRVLRIQKSGFVGPTDPKVGFRAFRVFLFHNFFLRNAYAHHKLKFLDFLNNLNLLDFVFIIFHGSVLVA